MGEARSRAEARRRLLTTGEPEPVYAPQAPRLRERVFRLLPDVDNALERERLAFNAAHGADLDLNTYLNAALAVFTEREAQARDALEQAKAVVEVQTKPGDRAKDLLAKMAPVVPRPAA